MKLSRRMTRVGLRWIVDSGVAGGKKRVLREFPSRAAAQGYIDRTRLERGQIGDEWLDLTAGERLDAVRALALARQRGITLVDAVKAYVVPPKASATVQDASTAFLSAKTASGKRDAYTAHLSAIIGQFVRGRETALMDSITSAMVREFLDPTKYQPPTLQGMRRRLATWFAWCRRYQLCTVDPMAQVDSITVDHVPPRILTVEQCRALLTTAEHTDRGMIPWLALGLFCGIRPEEIRRLTWAAVKLDRGFVEVSGEASKVRARRLVHLLPAAVAWLRLGGDLPPSVFWPRIRRLRASSGLTDWPPDVLRHTAASMMLVHYRDVGETALELGNSPDVLMRHYRELVTRDEAAEFWSIRPQLAAVDPKSLV